MTEKLTQSNESLKASPLTIFLSHITKSLTDPERRHNFLSDTSMDLFKDPSTMLSESFLKNSFDKTININESTNLDSAINSIVAEYASIEEDSNVDQKLNTLCKLILFISAIVKIQSKIDKNKDKINKIQFIQNGSEVSLKISLSDQSNIESKINFSDTKNLKEFIDKFTIENTDETKPSSTNKPESPNSDKENTQDGPKEQSDTNSESNNSKKENNWHKEIKNIEAQIKANPNLKNNHLVQLWLLICKLMSKANNFDISLFHPTSLKKQLDKKHTEENDNTKLSEYLKKTNITPLTNNIETTLDKRAASVKHISQNVLQLQPVTSDIYKLHSRIHFSKNDNSSNCFNYKDGLTEENINKAGTIIFAEKKDLLSLEKIVLYVNSNKQIVFYSKKAGKEVTMSISQLKKDYNCQIYIPNNSTNLQTETTTGTTPKTKPDNKPTET